MSANPLWTLQHPRFRPDQMLRRLTPTAERTMTRAGRNEEDGLTREARLENAPSDARGFSRAQRAGSGASVCPACLTRPFTWPLACMEIADRVHPALARSRRLDTSLVFPTPSLTVAPYLSSDLPASLTTSDRDGRYTAAAGAL
jgi:hypothetical protein